MLSGLNMLPVVIFVVFKLINFGILEAHVDIDVNRLLPPGETHSKDYNSHEWRLVPKDSNGGEKEKREKPLLHDVTRTKVDHLKEALKVYQPREDPRLFYLCDTYLKKIGATHNTASVIMYPKNDVVLNDDRGRVSIRANLSEQNRMTERFTNCIRCPCDRTLVAKLGRNRVLLQKPRLLSCSGHLAPRNVRLFHMYGPKFGSLVENGSHVIIAKVVYKNTNLQICKFQVNVLIQGCSTPNNLVSHCDDRSRICNFTCNSSKLELHGASSLVCRDNMNWEGTLPICRARSWCEPPSPPDHYGWINCKGTTIGTDQELQEGSRCRVRCARGWKPNRRTVAVCRKGTWTHKLNCYSSSKRIK